MRKNSTISFIFGVCGQKTTFSAFSKPFSSFSAKFIHKKHLLFLLLEVFKLTKNCSKRIYFFPKNSQKIISNFHFEDKKDIEDRALES